MTGNTAGEAMVVILGTVHMQCIVSCEGFQSQKQVLDCNELY